MIFTQGQCVEDGKLKRQQSTSSFNVFLDESISKLSTVTRIFELNFPESMCWKVNGLETPPYDRLRHQHIYLQFDGGIIFLLVIL